MTGGGNTFAWRDNVLDAGKILDEAAAGTDDEPVILISPRSVTACGLLPVRWRNLAVVDLIALKEAFQADYQIIGLAQTGGDPDSTRVIYELRTGATSVISTVDWQHAVS